LNPIDRIAEFPPTQQAAALRRLAAEARFALTARGDCSYEDTLSDLIARDPWTELVDYADGFMADDRPRLDWILALNDVNVGAADGGESNLNYGFTVTGARKRLLLQPKLSGSPEYIGFHQATRSLFDLAFLKS